MAGKHKNKARDLDKGKAIEEESITPPSEGCGRSLPHGEGSSSTTSTSSDIQCNYFTHMSFECNGNWRLLTIPFLSQSNSNPVSYGVQIGMNDFLLISPAPADSSRAHRQKDKRGSHPRGDTSSAESSTNRNSSGASCSRIAGTISNERDADNSSKVVIDRSKAEKKARRNAKKKARRKEKRKEKLSSSTSASPTELQVLSEGCAPESSTAETFANNDMNHDQHVLHETTPEDQSSDFQLNVNDSGGDNNSFFNGSPESGIQTKDEMFPILEGPEENHDEELNCCDDMSGKGISNMPVSVILDSAPAGHETITEAGYEVNPSNLESKSVDLSQEICHTGKEARSSDQSLLNGVVTKFETQECANSDMQLVVPGKRDKQAKRLPQNGRKGKGNNHSMWRKVQRDMVSRSEDKNESKDENSGRLNLVEEQSAVHSHAIPECSKQEPRSATFVEKSVLVGNDPKLKVLSRVERSSTLAHGHEPATKNNFSGKKSSSMLMKSELMCEAHSYGADSSNISEAINETYRAKQQSEALQLATGGPIAEFERLINAATPVICLWKEVRICSSCSHEVNQPLCRNEIPNISLGQLWKWYEEHGCYGLEVPSEDFSYTKRSGFHHLAFRAYFVPSLSAIQLFEKPKSHAADKDDRVPNSGTSRPFETGKTSKNSSNFVHLPILATCILLRHCTLNSQVPSLPVHAKVAEDPELIFQYLESDLPQLRRPLHEKIKGLIREGDSQNKMYGDPRNLDSMKLNKLHPQSWYSVAWYPIYRIPHGEHRACFLTFHSFSHLVCRSSTFGSKGMNNCVVSPVVGLQSYNAQRWFHLKQFGVSQAGGTQKLNPSEILRERVQTLELASCVFAREVSMSRHSDHEFFLSRRW